MLALQIFLNGKLVATAGTAGGANACCTVSALCGDMQRLKPDKGPVIVSLGGLSLEQGKPASLQTWIEAMNCSIGDEITVRVLDAAEVDTPDSAVLPSGMVRLTERTPFLTRVISYLSGRGRASS